MNQRDKLIGLLEKTDNEYGDYIAEIAEDPYKTPRKTANEFYADRLLAEGVIVPPCKVGDTVYILDGYVWAYECKDCPYFEVGLYDEPHKCIKTKDGSKCFGCIKIKEYIVTQNDIYSYLRWDDFGKTVFLTREEAEKVLAERSGNEI